MVENFTMLSVEEQIEFAKTLLETINSEKVFSDETNFEFQDVEPDDITGGLQITASITNPISVRRRAAWSAGTEEGAEEDPGNNAEYENLLRDDVKKSFKTLVNTVGGYSVSLQIDDIEEDETTDAEVEISHLSHEDSGIGSYEYWGFKGYDSHPYVEVEGIITRLCDCNLTFYVEPTDATSEV